MIFDICIIIFAFYGGYKGYKGIVRVITRILSVILSFLVSLFISKRITLYINEHFQLNKYINNLLENTTGIHNKQLLELLNQSYISYVIIFIIVTFILKHIIRIILKFIFSVFNLPILKQINKLFGIILSFIYYLLMAILFAAVIQILCIISNVNIGKSLILDYLYMFIK